MKAPGSEKLRLVFSRLGKDLGARLAEGTLLGQLKYCLLGVWLQGLKFTA